MRRFFSRHLHRLGPWALSLTGAVLLALAGWQARQMLDRDARAQSEPLARRLLEAAQREAAPSPPPKAAGSDAWNRDLRQVAAAKLLPEKPPEPVGLEFTGAVLDGAGSMAFLRDRQGTAHMKSVGGEVDGWQVLEIKETSVTVKKGERQETLPLKPPS